jgi:hypothetical protein
MLTSLPPEIISEIVSHLEEDSAYAPQQVRDGKTVSLVCKGCRPLGQALRWRTLAIVSEQIPSLLDHFARHTRLAKLVLALKVDDFNDQTSPDQLPDLIATFVNLRQLTIYDELGLHISPIIQTAAWLQQLKTYTLITDGTIDWSSDVVPTFRNSFKSMDRRDRRCSSSTNFKSNLGKVPSTTSQESSASFGRTSSRARLSLDRLSFQSGSNNPLNGNPSSWRNVGGGN